MDSTVFSSKKLSALRKDHEKLTASHKISLESKDGKPEITRLFPN